MRIGIDYRPVTVAPYSGIARQVLAMEQAFKSRPNVEVVRFTSAPSGHPHRESACCPERNCSSSLHRPNERFHFEYRFLPRALRKAQIDIYIATANAGLPVWHTPQGIKYILLLHDVFQLTIENYHRHWLKAFFYRHYDYYMVSRSMTLADQIWTPSQYTAREAGSLFPACSSRLAVLPNAVPEVTCDKNIAPPLNLPKDYWLVVGTREPRKNIVWFVQQWKQAVDQSRSVQDGLIPDLVLVGDKKDLPEVLQDIPGLHFISGVDDNGLLWLYRHASRLWQPSKAEGFGLPVVEAMGQGTPVAVAFGSALDEIAPPETVRFSPDDGDALQQKMRNLGKRRLLPAESPELLQSWARHYAMPAYIERLWQLIDKLKPLEHKAR